MTLYPLIHGWLSYSGIIKFIVTFTAVTNNVQNYILVETLSILSCKFEHTNYIVNIITIYM